MEKKSISIEYKQYKNKEELPQTEQTLLKKAISAT